MYKTGYWQGSIIYPITPPKPPLAANPIEYCIPPLALRFGTNTYIEEQTLLSHLTFLATYYFLQGYLDIKNVFFFYYLFSQTDLLKTKVVFGFEEICRARLKRRFESKKISNGFKDMRLSKNFPKCSQVNIRYTPH